MPRRLHRYSKGRGGEVRAQKAEYGRDKGQECIETPEAAAEEMDRMVAPEETDSFPSSKPELPVSSKNLSI